ncbi:Cell adhesion molecule /down-regulated by oncogene [Fasciola gigantica]|uniref:Cell adhesion molecule /down-regulated by oncogene n=1 Tax=Fasciola gigantica TaxID=46835 RepID=A0A504Z568_FASGI|nr:Cell adhesion molecule /down-regulated by oncogene [Fasciola gigantica]
MVEVTPARFSKQPLPPSYVLVLRCAFQSEVTTKDLTPKAEAVYDNLAVYLVWQPLRPELSGIEHTSKEVEYRLEYSVQTSPAEEQRNNPNATRPLTALVGLVGHEAVRWSDPTPLKQQTSTPYAYVTGDPLKPSKRYRFRTIAVDPSTGVSLVPPSDWSNVVSMEHISMVEPPQIKMVRPLSNGRIHLMWIFDGADESSRKLAGLFDVHATAQVSGPNRMGTSTDTFPGFESDSGSFVPDHFLVLARPLVKPKSDSSGSYEYGAYWATRINGSEAREGMLTGLNRTASYQVIVYGVRGDGDRRQITRFSKAAYVNLAGFSGTNHQFGSQQPLNRATTPAQQGMGDGMMEYHMQTGVYAHQQPQLPPVPHPQNTDMPTHHLMLNGTQRSVGYYPGPMTPSGTSLKREPPTGGSLQDGSAYATLGIVSLTYTPQLKVYDMKQIIHLGTLLQRGQLTGSVIHDPSVGPMSPPVGYAAQYYHGSQQALHMGQNMYPSGMASPQPGHGPPVYSPPPPPPLPQQQQAMFASQPGYPGYYGQTFSPQPEPMGHNPHGFGPTDGESIYSYFSQQEMGQSNAHQPLNPLPEENQASITLYIYSIEYTSTGNGAGFVDSGMQTGDGGNDAGPEGSPAGGGSHRHHRRRRRKQQQQQQRTTGELSNGSNRLNDQGDSAPGEGTQFGEVHSNTQLDEQRPSFDHEMTAPKRHHSISAGTYSDADPNSTQQSFNMSNDASRPGYMRFDSPQRGQMFTGQMPPPNQPPPPPPPAVALGLTMPGLVNGGGGVAVSSQEHPNMHHNSLNNYGADSLSRRPNGAPSVGATGTPVTGAYPTSGPGLLVGPPPRIRDYSEYGIPRGIGLPPTPSAPAGGGQPQPPQHNVLMGNPAMVQHGHSNMMMYEGRYREGQA